MMKRNLFKLVCRQLYCYFFADRINGKYTQVKAKDHRVNLFDFRPDYEGVDCYNHNRYNLGDYLGFVVADFMLKKRGLSLDTWVPKKRHMNSVGATIFSSYQTTTIWGSGVHHAEGIFLKQLHYYPFRRLDIRSVRGPLSREVLLKMGHQCPAIYGDPALLMPLVYQPQVEKTSDLLVISQIRFEVQFRTAHPGLTMVSMNTNDYKAVIDAIASSKKVISSSLHGIILAEAYGVPAVMFRSYGKNVDFKYLDYYASTGRYDVPMAETFEEACQMEPLPLPDIKPLQEAAMATFPYDLWDQ